MLRKNIVNLFSFVSIGTSITGTAQQYDKFHVIVTSVMKHYILPVDSTISAI